MFGMGTGVAPPLSPPESSVGLTRSPSGEGKKRGLFSFGAGLALSGLFAKQVPANKATGQQIQMPGLGFWALRTQAKTRKN